MTNERLEVSYICKKHPSSGSGVWKIEGSGYSVVCNQCIEQWYDLKFNLPREDHRIKVTVSNKELPNSYEGITLLHFPGVLHHPTEIEAFWACYRPHSKPYRVHSAFTTFYHQSVPTNTRPDNKWLTIVDPNKKLTIVNPKTHTIYLYDSYHVFDCMVRRVTSETSPHFYINVEVVHPS